MVKSRTHRFHYILLKLLRMKIKKSKVLFSNFNLMIRSKLENSTLSFEY